MKFVGGGDATGAMGDFYVPTGYAANLPANAFRRPKYRFVKWQNFSAGTDYPDKAAFTGAADGTTVTLDAVWEFVGDYTLRFEGNSAAATGVPEAVEMPVGTAYTIPADPVREGWQFDGWTNAVNATIYKAGAVFSEDVAANQVFTLFAKWSETGESGLTYTDGNGTEWTYDRTGDVIRITDADPGAGVDALDVPPPFKGATEVKLDDSTILPERQNGLWWKYRVTSNSAEITGYAGTVPANLVIPSTLGGRTVVGVAAASQGLFEGVETLKSVEFPGSMTRISRYLFNSCPNLETVVFHEGLEEINGSFRDCPKLKEITFPASFKGFPGEEDSFNDSGRSDRGYDKYGLRYVDTAHTIICETDPNWTGTLVIPDGVRFVAAKRKVFTAARGVRDCVLPEGLILRGGMFWNCLIQSVSIHETATRAYPSATAGSYNEITTVTVRGGAPSWNLKEYFTELTTVAYYRNQAAKWADYKAAHPDVTYVELDSGYRLFEEIEDKANLLSAAAVYNGYLYTDEESVAGTIQVKAAKAKANKKTGQVTSKLTVALQVAGEKKKVSLKGELDVASGEVVISAKDGRVLELVLGADGMIGTFGRYEIDGARDLFASKTAEDKALANAVLTIWKGTLALVFDGGSLTVNIGAKGKTKVAGTLSDGSKVSVSAQMIVGDDLCAIPVAVSKKGVNLAFCIWLSQDGEEADVVGLGDDIAFGRPGVLPAGAAFAFDPAALSALLGDGTYAAYFPVGIAVEPKGSKWIVAGGAKAGKVVLGKDGTVDAAKAGANPSALKLTYKAKDGSFSGSFKAYVNARGKPKAVTVSVSGVLVDGVGYGTASVKKAGSVPVTISAH